MAQAGPRAAVMLHRAADEAIMNLKATQAVISISEMHKDKNKMATRHQYISAYILESLNMSILLIRLNFTKVIAQLRRYNTFAPPAIGLQSIAGVHRG